ncbi:MAG: GNAT family N-acetyltransferase [Planctomycetaceae bacterium]
MNEPSSTPAAVVIRPARGTDIAGLAGLIEPQVRRRRLLRRTIDELALLLPNYFVADAAGRLAGCVALEIYSSKLAEVRSLVVDSEFQGQGIGKRLVQAAVDRAREENILEVMAITSEEEFFQSCGFDFTLPGEKKALFFQTRKNS